MNKRSFESILDSRKNEIDQLYTDIVTRNSDFEGESENKNLSKNNARYQY